MKNVILFSDLDRTIIHSSKFLKESVNPEIVEFNKDKKPISYMEKEALLLLNELSNNLLFIPVTTRSLEQYKRIDLKIKPLYSITSNGGIILKNNKRLKSWDDFIKNNISNKNYMEIQDKLKLINKYLTRELTLIDNVFFFSKINDNNLFELNYELDNILKYYDWTYTIQGNKIYIMPKFISKENAINYLLRNELSKDNFIITAGDGKLDYNFVFLPGSNLSIVPLNSELYNLIKDKDFKFNSFKYNTCGTLDMLKYIKQEINYKWDFYEDHLFIFNIILLIHPGFSF